MRCAPNFAAKLRKVFDVEVVLDELPEDSMPVDCPFCNLHGVQFVAACLSDLPPSPSAERMLQVLERENQKILEANRGEHSAPSIAAPGVQVGDAVDAIIGSGDAGLQEHRNSKVVASATENVRSALQNSDRNQPNLEGQLRWSPAVDSKPLSASGVIEGEHSEPMDARARQAARRRSARAARRMQARLRGPPLSIDHDVSASGSGERVAVVRFVGQPDFDY